MEDVFPLSSTTVLDCVKNTLAYYIYQDNLSLDTSEELLQPESYCIQNRQLVLCFDSYTLGRDGTTITCPITLGGQMKTAAEQRSMLQKNEWIGFWCASEDNGQVSRLVMDMSFETDGFCSVAFGFLETNLMVILIMIVCLTIAVVIMGTYTGYHFGFEHKRKAYVGGAILLWIAGFDVVFRYAMM